MNILGISAFYHDSAACLVQDGKIVAAAQEERFTRKKHDYRFPAHAVDYCLAAADLQPEDLDQVAFYFMAGGRDPVRARRGIELFAKEVMPEFKES